MRRASIGWVLVLTACPGESGEGTTALGAGVTGDAAAAGDARAGDGSSGGGPGGSDAGPTPGGGGPTGGNAAGGAGGSGGGPPSGGVPADMGPTDAIWLDLSRTDGTAACGTALRITPDTLDQVPAVVPCRRFESLEINLCDGMADEVVLPALVEVEDAFVMCLDAGDTVRLRGLANIGSADWRLRSGGFTLETAELAVRGVVELQLEAPGEVVRLPHLVSTGAKLEAAGGEPARELHLPDLQRVESLVVSGGVQVLTLDALADVSRLAVLDGPGLTHARMPSLTHVGDGLRFTGPDFVELEAPRLERVDGLMEIASGPQAAVPEFPALAHIRTLHLGLTEDCPPERCPAGVPFGPSEYRFPRLASVDDVTRLMDTRAAQRLVLPALERTLTLIVARNEALRELELPSLRSVIDRVVVRENPRLPDCAAFRVLESAGAPRDSDIAENLEGCDCDRDPPVCP